MDKILNDFDYEVQRAYKWKHDDMQYVVIVHENKKIKKIEGEEEPNASPSRDEEVEATAFIVDDPEFGKLPYNSWKEKRSQHVFETLKRTAEVISDPSKIDVIARELLWGPSTPLIKCPKCHKGVSKQATFCLFCGSSLYDRKDYFKTSSSKYAVIAVAIIIVAFFAIIFSSSARLFIPPFEKEINYYLEDRGYTIDETQTWEEFKNLEGIYARFSKEQLRQQATIVARNHVRIYIDSEAEIIWLENIDPNTEGRYVYLWRP